MLHQPPLLQPSFRHVSKNLVNAEISENENCSPDSTLVISTANQSLSASDCVSFKMYVSRRCMIQLHSCSVLTRLDKKTSVRVVKPLPFQAILVWPDGFPSLKKVFEPV
jgi:hypothetical protein